MELVHLAIKHDDAIVLADLLESIGQHDFAIAISEAVLYKGTCRWQQANGTWGIACHPDIKDGEYVLVKRKSDGALQRVRVGEILIEAKKTKWPVRAVAGTERLGISLIKAVIETNRMNETL